MRIAIKQFSVRVLLRLLKALVTVKQKSGPIGRAMVAPLRPFTRALLRALVVPSYRIGFFLKRNVSQLVRPAKGRVLFFFSSRLVIHVAVICITAFVGFMNLRASEVRAEEFGSRSMLYGIVSPQEQEQVSVVSATGQAERLASSYRNDPALDPQAHIDFDYLGEPYVQPVGEVGTLVATPSEEPDVVPKREQTETYVVQDGDSLWGIAYRYGLNISTLLWANNLSFRSVIRPGQEIKIPPVDGVLYTVKSGDTLSAIVKRYETDAEKVISFNKLASADDLVIGEELMIPGGKQAAPVVRRTARVGKLFGGGVTGKGTWVWPTDWRVITQYFGWRHTGLDIDGNYNTYSYAANDGVVTFSGWRGGYGLMVELDHGNGFLTRYAHHSKNFVSSGAVVAAGDTIGATGSTGRSTGTHLHFEVIQGGRYRNPLDFIR